MLTLRILSNRNLSYIQSYCLYHLASTSHGVDISFSDNRSESNEFSIVCHVPQVKP